MKKGILVSFFLLVLMITGCKKDIFQFPYVPIRLDLGLYSDLGQLGPGESIFKDGYGVRGLIIYRDTENNYYVFDRACTYEKDFSCHVNKDASFAQVMECSCCKSRFLLGESADPIKGPASHALVRYNAFLDGDLLKITN
jgi:Rieske Fe-S protein